MIFSEMVRSSTSPARALPAIMARPMPKGTAASLNPRIAALNDFRRFQPLALVWRIALFLSRNSHRATDLGAQSNTPGSLSLEGSYLPGSGRFCGGYPQE